MQSLLNTSVQRVRTTACAYVTASRALLVSLPARVDWRRASRAMLPLLAYAAGYAVALYVLAALDSNAKIAGPSPLHAEVAVTVVALLLTPQRRWWPFLLVIAAFSPILYFWWLRLTPSAAVLMLVVALFVIIGGTSVLTVSLLRRFIGMPMRFASVGDIGRFLACAAVAALPAALIGSAERTFVFSWAFWTSWQVAYLGQVLGIAVFTPAILLWLTDGPRGLGLASRQRRIEFALLGLATLAVGVLLIATHLTDQIVAHALVYLLVPVLIWAAIRFGLQGLASTLALATSIVITGAVFKSGIFVASPAESNTVALQLFLLCVGVPLFLLAALVQERKQANVAVMASETRYRGVVETQTEMINRFRPDLTLTFVNDATCRFIGKSREEILGTSIVATMNDAAAARVRESVQALLTQPDLDALTIEHEDQYHDGTRHWQHWVNRAIRDAEGHVIELQGIGRDITERKQMEQALRESEARYRAAFDSAAIGVAVVDLAGRPLEVNEYVSQMVGYTADELRTMALRDVTHPDDVADNEALLRRALDGAIGSYQLEKRYRHKDGHSVWGRLSASLVRGQDGQPAYFVIHLEDVAPRKQLEQEREVALAEAEQRAEELDRVFEAMTDGVAVYDQDGREVRTNTALQRLLRLDLAPPAYATLSLQERMALFAARDERGRPLATDEGPLPRALRGDLATGSATMDMRSRTLDGRELELSVSAAPLRDGAGRVTGAVALFRDQTERRRLEREHAEQAQQLQTIFDAMADPLFVYDAAGRLLRANPAARHLLHSEQTDATVPLAERSSAFQIRDADGRPLPREDWPITHLLRGEVLAGTAAQDILLRLPDGRDAVLSFTGGPIYDGHGQLSAVVAIARDQTERSQLLRDRAEQAEQLDRIVEQMTEPLVVQDAAGRVVRVNAAMRRLVAPTALPSGHEGLPLPERVGLYSMRDAQGRPIAPEETPHMRALRGEEVTGEHAMDVRLRTLGGRDAEVRISAAPLRDRNGKIIGVVGVGVDLTERNQLAREREEALAHAQARSAELEAVLGAMTDGVAVYDPTGHITYTNPAVRTLFALDTRPDFERLSVAERAALTRARTPDGQALPVDQLPQARVLRGEILASSAASDHVEETLDGRVLTLHVAGSPLRGGADGISGAVLVFRDVTEERHLQHATRQLAVQLQATLDAMTDAVFLYDTDGHVLRLNAAAQALVDAEPDLLSVAGTDWWERVRRYHPRRPEGHLLPLEEWPLARVLRGETLASVEVEDVVLTDAQGHEQLLNYVGGPACDAAGKLMGSVFVVRDVTERRRLAREREEARASELALSEVNERLDTFITLAAHDMRAPLGSSRMVVERAQKLLGRATEIDAASSREQQARAMIQAVQAVEMTRQGLDRLWRLVQQLLDASRVKQGTLVLQRQTVDLVELVRSGVDEHRLLNPSRVIAFDLVDAADGGTAPIVVDADSDRLSQVLTNYLGNAVRYSPEDQPIEVGLQVLTLAPEGGGGPVVRVAVRDHGPGIPPEEQATIWGRFQRARSVQEAGGLGLGLYIARILIELHGGQVGVESTPGEGSTFWFTLSLPRNADSRLETSHIAGQ